MYQITVRGIKKIMKGELTDKINYIISSTSLQSELLNSLKWDLLEKLDSCTSHDELHTFCINYYRMSLEDWIKSL